MQMLEEIIIGPYLVVLNMVTVEIVGSAVFVVVFTYSYRRQDYHYLKFVSAKTPPSIVGRLFIECRDITLQVTQLTPRLIRVTGHNNTGTGAEPSYQPRSV